MFLVADHVVFQREHQVSKDAVHGIIIKVFLRAETQPLVFVSNTGQRSQNLSFLRCFSSTAGKDYFILCVCKNRWQSPTQQQWLQYGRDAEQGGDEDVFYLTVMFMAYLYHYADFYENRLRSRTDVSEGENQVLAI